MTQSTRLPGHRSTPSELLLRDMLDAPLIASFNRSADTRLHDWADRMTRCAMDRAARAAHRVEHGEKPPGCERPCKVLACSACRPRHKVRPYCKRIWHRWGESGADNEYCSLITTHIKRIDDILDLPAVVVEHRRQWRDLRDARSSWLPMLIDGMVECDHVKDNEIPFLPPDRGRMLPALPRIGSGSGGIWLPHSHLAVYHPGVEREEIEAVARAFWPGPCRVSVVPFDASKSPAENAATISAYGSKTKCASRVGFGSEDGVRFVMPEYENWSVATRCEFWSAFVTWQGGLQRLRLYVGPHSCCAKP